MPTASSPLPRNIILMGFMGTGKSTLGRILARQLGWKYLDTDRIIEEEAGKPIAEIFKDEGEPAFRDRESAVAARLASMESSVIATGGGFPIRPENLAAALAAGEAFLLVASPEEIWHRVARSRHRPLLETDDPQGRIRELLAERDAAYQAIPRKIRTDGRSPDEIAAEILETLKTR